MITVRLEMAEIQYLRELVNEAWAYKRRTSFPKAKQMALSVALTRALSSGIRKWKVEKR